MSQFGPVDYAGIRNEFVELILSAKEPVLVCDDDGNATYANTRAAFLKLVEGIKRVRAAMPSDVHLADCGPLERSDLRRLAERLDILEDEYVVHNLERTLDSPVDGHHITALEESLRTIRVENSINGSDDRDYVSATEIRTKYTPDGVVLDNRKLKSFLGIHKDIRTKRPLGKNGEPRKNRLLVHFADWAKAEPALLEWYNSEAKSGLGASDSDTRRRKEAVDERKRGKK